MKLRNFIRNYPNETFVNKIDTYQNHYKMKRFDLSLSSLIGLQCESGDIEDCKLGMTAEILPDSCKGILMFSKKNDPCGSKCDSKPDSRQSPMRRGWLKWIRYS